MLARLTRLCAAVMLATLLIAMSAGRVAACRCMTPNDAQAMAAADVVFEGEVVAVVLQPQPHGPAEVAPPVVYRFTVNRPLKGPVEPGPVNISAEPEMRGCGIAFTAGERWVIFATAVDATTLLANACSGSHLADAGQLTAAASSQPVEEVPIQVLGVAAAMLMIAVASAVAFGVGRRPRGTR